MKKYIYALFIFAPACVLGAELTPAQFIDQAIHTVGVQCIARHQDVDYNFLKKEAGDYYTCSGDVVHRCLNAAGSACDQSAIRQCRGPIDVFLKSLPEKCPIDKTESASAKILSITGEIIVRNGAGALRAVSTGDALSEKDEVHTGPDSSVVIEFPDGHRVTVVAATEVKLAVLFNVKNRLKTEVLLKLGEIRAQTPPRFDPVPGYSFEVKSPTATMSIRGTIFTVAYDPKTQTTKVVTTEGEVLVTPTNSALAPLSVGAGESATVTQDKETGGKPVARGTVPESGGMNTTNIAVGALLALVVIGVIFRRMRKA